MNRRIITSGLHAAGQGEGVDRYIDRLIKYIPAEIVGAWIAMKGVVPDDKVVYGIAFLAATILTAAWIWKQTRVQGQKTAFTQIAISTASFVVWAYALEQPFKAWGIYMPWLGSLLLIFYSLIVALIVPADSAPGTP